MLPHSTASERDGGAPRVVALGFNPRHVSDEMLTAALANPKRWTSTHTVLMAEQQRRRQTQRTPLRSRSSNVRVGHADPRKGA